MLCRSCGNDNPRENRYCGMCGMPFPYRPLTVPEAQSTLTFSSAPLEIAPSHLSVSSAGHTHFEREHTSGHVDESPSAHATMVAPVEPEPAPPEAPQTPPVELPIVSLSPEMAETPVEVQVQSAEPALHEAFLGDPTSGAVHEPEEIPAEVPAQQPSYPVAAEYPPIVVTEPQIETEPEVIAPSEALTPPPIAAEAVSRPTPREAEVPPPRPTPLPEIRKFTSPVRRPILPRRVDAPGHGHSVPHRPADSQPMAPAPDSAGMPTFQSVVEVSGAPFISPFEPPLEKDADEERDLQEFVAGFRYNPPNEAFDELTMRSEVPVLDAAMPVTPSHPSFDDDVPPPPEVGAHPTGAEYYPAPEASAHRSRYLEIGETQPVRSTPSEPRANTSFLGLDDSHATIPPAIEEPSEPTARRSWLLWSSLAALLAIMAGLGFLEGRSRMDHAFPGPVELISQEYANLRQRASQLTATAPAATTDKSAVKAPASTESPTRPPTADKSAAKTQSGSTGAIPAATTADQQHPKTPPVATPSTPAIENKATGIPPTSLPVAVSPKPAETQPPVVAKPKSKPDPGQQELASATRATDPSAAAAWLWKATSRGNPVAPVRLADMYIKGKGVPHSCEQALVLLRSEAVKDNAPARNRLATLYANGTCVTRDRVKAYQLLSSALAVDPSNEWTQQNRKELWQEMTPEERSQAEKSH